MAAHEANIIAELTADHREVERLFGQFKELGPSEDTRRREVADEFTIELVRHSAAEEQHLYPAVREHVPGGDALADKELADHHKVEKLLKQLEDTDTADPHFDAVAARIVEEVLAHIKDEEGRLFPALLMACPQDYLFELGDKVRAAKKTAPTHPHPDAPSNKPVAAGTGLVDRIRDLFTGRGQS